MLIDNKSRQGCLLGSQNLWMHSLVINYYNNKKISLKTAVSKYFQVKQRTYRQRASKHGQNKRHIEITNINTKDGYGKGAWEGGGAGQHKHGL